MENLSLELPMAEEHLKKPYSHFGQASAQLTNLQAIDFFFAENVCQVLKTNNPVIFHLAVACHQYLQSGHSCLPISVIANSLFAQEVDEQSQTAIHAGYQFPTEEDIYTLLATHPELKDASSLIVLHNEHLYLRRYYLFEQQLAQAIKQKLSTPEHIQIDQASRIINTLFDNNSEQETVIDWQKVAVANALNKSFVVIAGGPGTGKTYTVTKLLAALIMQNKSQTSRLNIALSAPTGKAAQRLSESIMAAVNGFSGLIDEQVLSEIPTQAQTIHRLLGVRANQVNFKHNQDNLLPIDVLLVDEASMIDLALMTRIFRALPEHAKVILLGDADQLPSVASGSVLADIAPRPHEGFSQANVNYLTQAIGQQFDDLTALNPSRAVDHLTILQHSRRFDGHGGIGIVAKHVIAGEAIQAWQRLENDPSGQSELITQSQDTWLSHFADKYYKPLLSATDEVAAFELLAQFRILVSMRKGDLGVESINQRIVEHFVNNQLIDTNQAFKKQPLYHGMPIMITENHHKMGLYNGDIGIIWQQGQQLKAIFEQPEGIKTVIPSRLPNFELVYAMTIHKTQGSEFTHVLMALPDTQQHKLLTRELLYTGITRAKKQLSIFSNYSTWQQGVKAKVVRHSQLEL